MPTAVPARSSRTTHWPLVLLLSVAGLLAARFLLKSALPYLSLDQAAYGDAFWPRRYGLLLHLAGGLVALVAGPFQLWMGETRRRMDIHRTLGKVYMGAVAVGCLGGFYLSLTTPQVGWVYASGLFGLACAWTITTSFAYVAIRRRVIAQHREWMIRSYVVTFAFVFYRLFVDVLGYLNVGDVLDHHKAAPGCWAVPLLIAEPLIQVRKLRRPA